MFFLAWRCIMTRATNKDNQQGLAFPSGTGKEIYRAFREISFCLMIMAVLLTSACGGGGGGSDDPADKPQTEGLSVTAADPGQYITVNSSAIKTGEPALVTFKGANGYEVTVKALDISDGSLRIAVPAFVDLKSDNKPIVSSSLDISVNGQAIDSTLTVRDLPEIGNVQAGAVFSMLLQATKTRIEQARNRLNTDEMHAAADVTATLNQLQARIRSLMAMMDEIKNDHTLTVTYDGKPIVLKEQELKTLDRWVYATFSGIAHEIMAKGLYENPSSTVAYKQQVINPQESINIVVQSLPQGINWSNVVWPGVAAIVGVTGIVCGGPVAAIAVPISLGIAITYAAWDLIASQSFNWVLQGVETDSIAAYDLGVKAWDHAYDIASQGFSATGHWTAEMWDDIGQWINAFDLGEKIAEFKCEYFPSDPDAGSKVFMSKATSAQDDFCSRFDPSTAPVGGKVFATITFPGHNKWFVSGQVFSDLFYDSISGIYLPEIRTCSGEGCNVTHVDVDEIRIILSPDLVCGFSYPLEGDEPLATITFRSPDLKVTPAFDKPDIDTIANLWSVGGTLDLLRFGTEAGSRIKGTFSADLYGYRTDADPFTDEYVKTEMTGTINGSFDFVLEDPEPSFNSAMKSFLAAGSGEASYGGQVMIPVLSTCGCVE